MGTCGAGDCFCAGILYGIHNNYDYRKMLELGVMCGGINLFHMSATGSMTKLSEILEMKNKFPF